MINVQDTKEVASHVNVTELYQTTTEQKSLPHVPLNWRNYGSSSSSEYCKICQISFTVDPTTHLSHHQQNRNLYLDTLCEKRVTKWRVLFLHREDSPLIIESRLNHFLKNIFPHKTVKSVECKSWIIMNHSPLIPGSSPSTTPTTQTTIIFWCTNKHSTYPQ